MSGLRTPLCDLLGIRLPILQAPMANGPATPELAGAVSRAGGLGQLGLAGMGLDAAAAAVRRAVELADGAPVGANVFVAAPLRGTGDAAAVHARLAPLRAELGLPADPPAAAPAPSGAELAEVAVASGARVLSSALGDPLPLAPVARSAGIPLLAMVSTVAEGEQAAASGADAVVAQGSEAGGHRSSFAVGAGGAVPLVGTLALVRQAVLRLPVPVIGAGGVMDGAGLVAVLALGAGAAQLGTRFLVAREAGVPASWRTMVRRARDADTVVTDRFSGRPARGLPNRLLEALDGAGPPVGFPGQGAACGDVRRAAAAADRADLMAPFAGQAAGLAGEDAPAAEIVARIAAEAREAAARLGALAGG